MQTVVSAYEMKRSDETAIRTYGVPGLLLMDRAGTGAAHLLLARFAPLVDRPVTVVCGSGNNAGDGFVVARVLANHQVPVRVMLCTPASRFTGDAATQFRLLQRESRSSSLRIRIVPFRSVAASDDGPEALIVDAVFGTGFTGRPRGVHARAIEWINARHAPVASLDIPSGVDATTGGVEEVAVRAVLTITFGHVKSGLLLNEGRTLAGHVAVIDIGLPGALSADSRLQTRLVEQSDVRRALPVRPHRLHKYSAGKVLVMAGSKGYTGAATLATMGALRSGAGAVVLAHPDAVHTILARKLTEPILLPLASDESGGYASDLSPSLVDRLSWADALLVGPGIGRSATTARFLSAILKAYRGPVVLDADALTMLADLGFKHGRRRNWIVTPHTGEFSRLSGVPVGTVENDRVDVVRAFARQSGWTTVLKGSPTCTADPSGTVTINSTGNPGMATVGSGDVLAGLIAGFRSQQMPADTSAWAGVYVHGRAGDIARDRLGERSMLAGDILESIPQAIRELEDAG